MRETRLIGRSLVYFRAGHAALLAGMMLVAAVLTGALLLGDSVDDSLRDLATRRRGGYETLITSERFFSHDLANRVGASAGRLCDAGLVLPGRVRGERSGLSTGAQVAALPRSMPVAPGTASVSRPLADALGLRPGDAILVTLPGIGMPADAVLAHRDRSVLASQRVTLHAIIDESDPDEAFGCWFDLHPSQRAPRTIWLNLTDLQQTLGSTLPPGERLPRTPANVLLLGPGPAILPAEAMTLEDYGLGFSRSNDALILRSGTLYIPPSLVQALLPLQAQGQGVYTLLLDRVSADRPGETGLSYVMAAGLSGRQDLGLKDNQVALNQWTADALRVRVGDVVRLAPYRVSGDAVVADEASAFTVARIVPMTGVGADPTLTPTFHGLTDAATVAAWNPPAGFPFDRARVTPADETYWNEHQAAPRIFFTLAAAQRLGHARILAGAAELTSLRFPPAQAEQIERAALTLLTPAAAGFQQRPFAPATAGSTDFGGLFLGLSGFLLLATLLLVVLLFRLAVEQRQRHLGVLSALGFSPPRVARLLLGEGLVVALAGTLAGLPLAVLYSHLLVDGLGGWWRGATGTHAITLHVHGRALALGAAISALAAALALALTAWRIARAMPASPLKGERPPGPILSRAPGLRHGALALAGFAVAVTPLVVAWAGALSAPAGFLLSGFLLLTLAVSLLAVIPITSRRAGYSLVSLAVAGIFRQRTRAVLCLALMAAAAFLLTSITAFEHPPAVDARPPSPTGGYQLIVSVQIPLPADLQTPAGRRLLGMPAESPLLASACFTPLKVKSGDDLSCLNMTRPQQATVIGVPVEVLERLSVARQRRLADARAVPAAVDQQTAQYILHAGLGSPLPVEAARPVVVERLLADSIFQNAALIPLDEFQQLFPEIPQSALVLVDCPPGDVPALRALLQSSLDDFGVTVETPAERLAAYHAVASSYIAAFQFLGALALLVGALGLVVVMARTVIQRRAEFALMQALGFPLARIVLLLVIEHGMLLAGGLFLGVLAALLAVLPQSSEVHLRPVAGALAIILACGLAVLVIAARGAMHRLSPAALRQE